MKNSIKNKTIEQNETHQYYDGTKILSMKDMNGNTPGLYIITSNRSAGKTTYFARLCINRFIKKKEKFIFLVRNVGQLHHQPEKFFSDIQGLFFNDYVMTDKCHDKDGYTELFLDNTKDKDSKPELCGYVIALNSATKIKNSSHLFNDCTTMWFDEFQTDTGYVPQEVSKFLSVYFSITRGNGKQFRYVPVYFTGNHIDLFNPYYIELGLCDKLKADTKFLKGEGYVVEQNLNLSAIRAREESGVVKAFTKNRYILVDKYMYDDMVITNKPSGKPYYQCTLKYQGEYYAIENYGYCVFARPNGDITYRTRYACTIDDIDENFPLLTNSSWEASSLIYYLRNGMFKFKNPTCKHVIFDILLPKMRIRNFRK